MKPTSRRAFLTNGLRLAGGLAIASCAPGAAPGAAPAPGAANATAGPAVRGNLIYAASSDVPVLDPFHNTGVPHLQVYNSLYDTVLGRDRSFKLVPKLAETWKALDATTWQFKLRPGVKFHNGDPLTAADVKFSIEYTYDPASKSSYATSFNTIARVDAVDDLTLNIVNKLPDPTLPDKLSIRPGYVLPQKYFRQVGLAAFNKQPVGSGPYQFKEVSPGISLTLVANPSYWGPRPNADSIKLILRPDITSRVAALRSGEVNFIDSLTADHIAELNRGDTKAVTAPGLGNLMFIPNVKIAPLDKKLVRQAMSLSLDRPTMNKTLAGGLGAIANSPLLQTDFAYDPSLPPLPYDAAKARSLLQQAGYKGEPIILTSLQTNSNVVQAAAELWKAVGLNISTQVVDQATQALMFTQQTFKGAHLTVFRSYYADPDGIVWRTMQPGGQLRYWTDPEFDRLGAEAASTVDQTKRLANYRRMIQMMVDEMAWISLWEDTKVFGTGKGVIWEPLKNGLTDDFHSERLRFQ